MPCLISVVEHPPSTPKALSSSPALERREMETDTEKSSNSTPKPCLSCCACCWDTMLWQQRLQWERVDSGSRFEAQPILGSQGAWNLKRMVPLSLSLPLSCSLSSLESHPSDWGHPHLVHLPTSINVIKTTPNRHPNGPSPSWQLSSIILNRHPNSLLLLNTQRHTGSWCNPVRASISWELLDHSFWNVPTLDTSCLQLRGHILKLTEDRVSRPCCHGGGVAVLKSFLRLFLCLRNLFPWQPARPHRKKQNRTLAANFLVKFAKNTYSL